MVTQDTKFCVNEKPSFIYKFYKQLNRAEQISVINKKMNGL